MKIFQINNLNVRSDITEQFDRKVEALQKNDFAAAEVKRLTGSEYYRAKLNDADRLIFAIVKHNGEKVILLLEIIYNHDYSKSRFLNGATIDESKLVPLTSINEIDEEEIAELPFLNTGNPEFHMLDKVISFDDLQQEAYCLPLPLTLIGVAGSGKTLVALEKMKQQSGRCLYLTRSQPLVNYAKDLYYAGNYSNDGQSVNFLSFDSFINKIHDTKGGDQLMGLKEFKEWYDRNRQGCPLQDPDGIYEEINSTITGMDITKPYLSREGYMALGPRQALFPAEEREAVYDIFEKYLKFINEHGISNLNILAHECLGKCGQEYDFIIVDEVQDMTNVQVALVLKALSNADNFIICGDAHQVVYPNQFNWARLNSIFFEWRREMGKISKIQLKYNHRNARAIVENVNTLQKMKNVVLGSVDRESCMLAESQSSEEGSVRLYPITQDNIREINKTADSVKYVVIVMCEEHKSAAKVFFKTDQIFTVQEIKGLEYLTVVIFNPVTNFKEDFDYIAAWVEMEDLNKVMEFSRSRDKEDKTLEYYKLAINSLIVSMTRAQNRVIITDENSDHEFYKLLLPDQDDTPLELEEEKSTKEEWLQQADVLQANGNTEQAEAIRSRVETREAVLKPILDLNSSSKAKQPQKKKKSNKKISLAKREKQQRRKQLRKKWAETEKILKEKKDFENYPHPVYARQDVDKMIEDAQKGKISSDNAGKLEEISQIYGYHGINKQLVDLNYIEDIEKSRVKCLSKNYECYQPDNIYKLCDDLQKYGINLRNKLNLTPLMMACRASHLGFALLFLDYNADPYQQDNNGRMAYHHLSINLNIPSVRKVSKDCYDMLVPPSMMFRSNGREFEKTNDQPEFHIFNLYFSILPSLIDSIEESWFLENLRMVNETQTQTQTQTQTVGVGVKKFVELFKSLSDLIKIPDLSEESCMRNIIKENAVNTGNGQLFFDVSGECTFAMINPFLELKHNGEWVNFYDLSYFKFLSSNYSPSSDWLYTYVWMKYIRDAGLEAPLSFWDIKQSIEKIQMAFESLKCQKLAGYDWHRIFHDNFCTTFIISKYITELNHPGFNEVLLRLG